MQSRHRISDFQCLHDIEMSSNEAIIFFKITKSLHVKKIILFYTVLDQHKALNITAIFFKTTLHV